MITKLTKFTVYHTDIGPWACNKGWALVYLGNGKNLNKRTSKPKAWHFIAVSDDRTGLPLHIGHDGARTQLTNLLHTAKECPYGTHRES